MDKEDGDATYTMERYQRIIKPHVNMAKPLYLSKSTKSDWIEGASMTEMQWIPWDSAEGYINHTCPEHDSHNDP